MDEVRAGERVGVESCSDVFHGAAPMAHRSGSAHCARPRTSVSVTMRPLEVGRGVQPPSHGLLRTTSPHPIGLITVSRLTEPLRNFSDTGHMKSIAGLLLILTAIIGSAVFVRIGTERSFSSLENTLLQVFAIALSIAGSIVFGRESARDAARDLVKPHARSAFRRLVSLYKSLSRVAGAIEEAREHNLDGTSDATLDTLSAIIAEQLATADDALEDWNDIVPEDVKELREQLKKGIAQGAPNAG